MSSEFRKRKRSSEPGDINRREERCSRSRDHASSKKKTHGHRHDNEDRSPTTGEDSEAGSIDDSVGHYYGTQGTLIKERYRIEKEIGCGTFGKVFDCFDLKYDQHIAIKVVRNIPKYVDSAKIEARILDEIYRHQKQSQTDGCVKLYSHFHFEGFYCLVTELLGQSLYDIIKKNHHRGYPMSLIRSVSRQLLETLDFLKSIRLIHTGPIINASPFILPDHLKVENILFTSPCVRHADGMYLPTSNRIKLIDFGGATYDDEHKSTIINTRQYRGPEVTLELGWSYPSDIWSVGCIIGELYSGDLFFQTHDSLEHIGLMERIISHFPRWMIQKSPLRDDYFDRRDEVRWRELPKSNRDHIRRARSIQDFFALSSSRPDRSGIADLVEGLLRLDPHERLTPRQALKTPYFRDP